MREPKFIHASALDIRQHIPDNSIHCVVTSPPYFGMRAYEGSPVMFGGAKDCAHEWETIMRKGQSGGTNHVTLHSGPYMASHFDETESAQCTKCGAWLGHLGLEPTVDLFIDHLVSIFAEVWHVLRDDGQLFVNLDDKRSKTREWLCVPEKFVFAMQAAGWRFEDKIIWWKKSTMPNSHKNRCVHDWEYIFQFNKNRKHAFFDSDAIREPAKRDWRDAGGSILGKTGWMTAAGRNDDNRADGTNQDTTTRAHRAVWALPQYSFEGSHFAVFPPSLPRTCIKAGTSEAGCCPTCGAPWERVVERERISQDEPSQSLKLQSPGVFERGGNQATYGRIGDFETRDRGFRPACTCPEHEPIPCTVLDIFSGSGTTPIVAEQLGRFGVGVEISEKYIKLARERWAGEVWREHGAAAKEADYAKIETGIVGVQQNLFDAEVTDHCLPGDGWLAEPGKAQYFADQCARYDVDYIDPREYGTLKDALEAVKNA